MITFEHCSWVELFHTSDSKDKAVSFSVHRRIIISTLRYAKQRVQRSILRRVYNVYSNTRRRRAYKSARRTFWIILLDTSRGRMSKSELPLA